MRTPNTNCVVCNKPLYRRPKELKKYLFACCFECRSAYYKMKPVSENLVKGWGVKGTNNLEGKPKSEESKIKRSISLTEWCKVNPEKLKQRGTKIRAESHYRWNGGITYLNKAIRLMTENRKWAKLVKERDGHCVICGSIDELESDHLIPLSVIIELAGINNIEEARNNQLLWNVNNGITLCRKCHCAKDNRKYSPNGKGKRSKIV